MRAWVLRLGLAAALAGCGTAFAVRHRVQPGESLESIAGLYGMSAQEVREFNRLEPGDRLREGDTVFVPGAAVRREPRRPEAAERGGAAVPPEAPLSPYAATPGEAGPPPAGRAPLPAAAPPPAPPAAREGERSGGTLRWPADGEVLRGFGTSPAGESRGIDIGLPPGTAVRAAGPGTVTYAGTPASAYGPLVIVEHEGRLFTVYGNLRDLQVEKGQRVEGGRVLGTSGSRDAALPPHLHFEVRRGQAPEDPLLHLPPR